MVLTAEEKKARKKEYQKQWREANREKLKEYQKQWREANCEKIKESIKQWREANCEKIKEYREANREKAKQYQKEYDQTDVGKKSRRISKWKFRGVVGDFDELYERYLNTHWCDECECELTLDRVTTATTKVLDHDHQTGEFRNILCNSCNRKRG